MEEQQELVIPSALPLLEACRCFESAAVRNEAMIRGSAVDRIIRHHFQPRGLTESDTKWLLEHPEDLEPVTWACETITKLAHGELVHTNDANLKPMSFDPGLVKKGTMDAACYKLHWLLDIKTGDKHDYTAQMACYAANCMTQYGVEEWTTYLAFVDKKELVERVFSKDDTEVYLRGILAKPKVETPHDRCSWCIHYSRCCGGEGKEDEK